MFPKCLVKFRGYIPKLNIRTYYRHNFPSPHTIYHGQQKHSLDPTPVTKYNKIIQLFLQKHRIHKSEIAPKMASYILSKSPKYNKFTSQQRLCNIEVLYKEKKLSEMENKGIINSGYIISTFLEEYEKNMLDIWLEYKLINGQMEPISRYYEMQEVEGELERLMNAFYYGEELSTFERYVQTQYLMQKYIYSPYHLSTTDINLLQGQIRCLMNHPHYQSFHAPLYTDLHSYAYPTLLQLYTNLVFKELNFKQKVIQLVKLWDIKTTSGKLRLEASLLFQRIVHYTQSYEFNDGIYIYIYYM